MNRNLEERARLGSMGKFTITFEATESTLELIKALLLYGDRPEKPVEPLPEEPFPFDAPPEPDPNAEAAFLANIDFAVVRRSIIPLLEKYVEKHGREKGRELIQSFGAERFSEVPEAQLLGMHAGLEQEFPPADAPPRRRRVSRAK